MHVPQLADVAGPGALCSSRSAPGLSAVDRFCEPRCELLDERRGQVRDVVAALAQRRQLDLDDVQAVVQVLAEPARRDLVDAAGGWSPR